MITDEYCAVLTRIAAELAQDMDIAMPDMLLGAAWDGINTVWVTTHGEPTKERVTRLVETVLTNLRARNLYPRVKEGLS